MLNKLLLDNDYNVELLVNLEEPQVSQVLWNNSIYLEIDADSTPNQYLVLKSDSSTTVATLTVTPSQVNNIEIERQYWQNDGYLYIYPYKNGTALDQDHVIDIQFPAVIKNSGQLSSKTPSGYIVIAGQHYEIAGSEYAEEEVSEVKETVEEQAGQIEELQRNKQNFIELEIIDPTSSGEVGDIILTERSNNALVLWRYENNAWSKKAFAQYSDQDLTPGTSPLGTGEIYLVYE